MKIFKIIDFLRFIFYIPIVMLIIESTTIKNGFTQEL